MVGSLLCDGLPLEPIDTKDAAEQRAHQEVAAEEDSQREEEEEADYDDSSDEDSAAAWQRAHQEVAAEEDSQREEEEEEWEEADTGSHESEPTYLDVNKRKRSRPNSLSVESVEQMVREGRESGAILEDTSSGNELLSMSISALEKRARARGATYKQIDAALSADLPKIALAEVATGKKRRNSSEEIHQP